MMIITATFPKITSDVEVSQVEVVGYQNSTDSYLLNTSNGSSNATGLNSLGVNLDVELANTYADGNPRFANFFSVEELADVLLTVKKDWFVLTLAEVQRLTRVHWKDCVGDLITLTSAVFTGVVKRFSVRAVTRVGVVVFSRVAVPWPKLGNYPGKTNCCRLDHLLKVFHQKLSLGWLTKMLYSVVLKLKT